MIELQRLDEYTTAVTIGAFHLLHITSLEEAVRIAILDGNDNLHYFDMPYEANPPILRELHRPVIREATYNLPIGDAKVTVEGDKVALRFREQDSQPWGQPFTSQLKETE